jgi:hypothetical protein
MPTPFSHLAVAEQLLVDEAVSPDQRAFIEAERSAFLLGNIAADARVSSGLRREQTHFYAYGQPIEGRLWRLMLQQHPTLNEPMSDAQRVFLAGYVAHLTMDEIWTLEMVRPEFREREWRTPEHRFLMLHLILSFMDDRDYRVLSDWQRETLAAAGPNGWTPFMTDDDLRGWRDFIAEQFPPDGSSQTLDIFAQRVKVPAETLHDLLHSPDELNAALWQYIPLEKLQAVEAQMYIEARDEMRIYLEELA